MSNSTYHLVMAIMMAVTVCLCAFVAWHAYGQGLIYPYAMGFAGFAFTAAVICGRNVNEWRAWRRMGL